MSAEERRLKVLLIEDDTRAMRTLAWALRQGDTADEADFDVEIVSKREALEVHGLEAFDIAVFNMEANADDKTQYNHQLRMLNPNCIIIDVDQFVADGQSVRDSAADSYTERPLDVGALRHIIKDMSGKSLEERTRLLADAERELRGSDRTSDSPADGGE